MPAHPPVQSPGNDKSDDRYSFPQIIFPHREECVASLTDHKAVKAASYVPYDIDEIFSVEFPLLWCESPDGPHNFSKALSLFLLEQ